MVYELEGKVFISEPFGGQFEASQALESGKMRVKRPLIAPEFGSYAVGNGLKGKFL